MVCTKKKSAFVTLFLSVALLFSLFLSNLTPVNAQAETRPVTYLALGDSLAAGQTPYLKIGKGYTDLLAEDLDEIGFLTAFSKQYAFSGYTSKRVLEDIRNDVRKGKGDTTGIRAHITVADIITLNTGANDLLQKIKRTEEGLSIDPADLSKVLTEVESNIKAILEEIHILNPHAHVYVMGYYNAYPYLPVNQQEQFLPILNELNDTIKEAVISKGGVYVPTKEVIAVNVKVNLPNPSDIHPSVKGYEKIGGEFWKVILPTITNHSREAIYVNGLFQTFDQDPVYINGRTLVHVRGVFDDLGATVSWDSKTNSVIIKKGIDVVKLELNSNKAYKNGVLFNLDASAKVINNRTMIPLRFISESIGAKVKWMGRQGTFLLRINIIFYRKYPSTYDGGVFLCYR
ncbi:stalk domain-containing protein [Fictibacillus phosphorivorans]|uniref:stalk domain-containing protein n=1 Tax=Fictibacillus phosphorivorans TaxID=1221500 RepID=UPI00203C80C5|nr:stalk domain-containing protein [Fictibacillus phosphorivorans]MCM3718511.1 stalk domain-containing protein [Fictibacillus phosphorivorans]MCM3776133.1 stalk domain-containing protein [Fictibacillus phosphorivorans]